MKDTAERWIRVLDLRPHPEGGCYREIYRAGERIPRAALPARYPAARVTSTAIYFLLRRGECSAFHRLKSDELWHFYRGSPLCLHLIDPRGRLTETTLGPAPERGQTLVARVPAGCWFAAELAGRGRYALVGCTVAPGFDMADFELGDRAELCGHYPQHRRLIERMSEDG